MRGATLTGTAPAGNALVAEAIRVTGEVFLDEGFEAARAVRLAGASIGSQLGMRGATLTGTAPAGNALVAEAMRVTNAVYLDRGFEAAGAVQYDPANHASARRYKPVQDAYPPVSTTVRGH